MRSVEKMSYFQFFMLISHSPLLIPHSHFSNVHAGCRRRGVCNMEINKSSLMPLIILSLKECSIIVNSQC